MLYIQSQVCYIINKFAPLPITIIIFPIFAALYGYSKQLSEGQDLFSILLGLKLLCRKTLRLTKGLALLQITTSLAA